MIILKSSFQTFLIILIVWISFTCAPPNSKQLRICKKDMITTFGIGASALDSIKTAILNFILGFDVLSKDVTDYYLTFHEAVKSNNILVPPEYCYRVTKGYEEVWKGKEHEQQGEVEEGEEEDEEAEEGEEEDEEAEEEEQNQEQGTFLGHEEIMQGAEYNWQLWQGVAKEWYGPETVWQEKAWQEKKDEFQEEENEFQREDDEFQECESSFRNFGISSDNFSYDIETGGEGELSEDDNKLQACENALIGFGTKLNNLNKYKKSVLYSALYQHKQIAENSVDQILYTNNCHSQGYGFDYLDHITKVIFLKDGNMDSPEEFCIGRYGKQNDPVTLV